MEWKYAMLFALLLAVPAFAVGPNGLGPKGEETMAERLDAAMDNAVCKTDFMVGSLESMMDNVEGVDYLQDDVDTLNDDMDTLQGYVDSGDNEGFWSYVKDTYIPNMEEAKQGILDTRHETNISEETKQALRDEYDSMKEEYQSCNFDSAKRFGEAKVEAYEAVLDNAEEKITHLNDKGVDTSGLTQLVEDARSDLVEPLSDALDSADNATEVKDALRAYCLFNGCVDGTNFHFAARFEVEKLESVLEAISDKAAEAGLGDDMESAQDDLGSAQSVLDDVGSEEYSEGQQDQLSESLHSAADTIRDILSSLRSG